MQNRKPPALVSVFSKVDSNTLVFLGRLRNFLEQLFYRTETKLVAALMINYRLKMHT